MKKTLATALAFYLTLSLCDALAQQTQDIQAITNEISFEAQKVLIGDTGLAVSLPEDWSAGEPLEGTLAVYYAADGSAALSFSLLDATMDDIWKQCFAAAESCLGAHLAEAYVNDAYYLFYSAPLQTAAYLALADDTVLVFTFDYASVEASGSSPALEIIGSIHETQLSR